MTLADKQRSAVILTLAEELRDAAIQRAPAEPIAGRHPELDPWDAYAIQQRVREFRQAGGVELVGLKVGLASPGMRSRDEVGALNYGLIFDDDVLFSSGEIVRAALIAPRIEPEIAFVIGEQVGGPSVTPDDVLAATESVVASLEVLDTRYGLWDLGLFDSIADNASAARVVLCDRRVAPGRRLDLAAIAVDLLVDGRLVESGTGARVLGHPAEAVAWLARTLDAYGLALEAGDLVLPGPLTEAVPLEAGSTYVADFGALGSVQVRCV